MQQHEEDNHIIKWFKSDDGLCDLINTIDAKNLTIDESARLAFYEASDYLRLPKHPEDITEQMYREFDDLDFEPESVFEQMAVINYMSDDTDDKRNLVMQALYNVFFKDYHNLNNAAVIYFGGKDKIPKSYTCYLFGTDTDAKIEFSIQTTDWINSGARMMKKVEL